MNHRIFILFVLSFIVFVLPVSAQSNVQCGSIVEGEFTEGSKRQDYFINLAPGDKLKVDGTSVGDYLTFYITVIGPSKRTIRDSGNYYNNPSLETGTLSAPGTYTIDVHTGGIGIYTLYIGCTLRDGTVIEPGDVPPTSTTTGNTTTPSQPVAPVFTGVGFPGLAPVDFSQVAKLPLPAGIAMGGAVTATGGEILGYTFSASAGDKLDLSFTRASGNLNLGLVVLSADNKVVYMAAMVTSETMTTRFTVPAAGEYTIGVFRLDLMSPPDPQPTAFQLQVSDA